MRKFLPVAAACALPLAACATSIVAEASVKSQYATVIQPLKCLPLLLASGVISRRLFCAITGMLVSREASSALSDPAIHFAVANTLALKSSLNPKLGGVAGATGGAMEIEFVALGTGVGVGRDTVGAGTLDE